VYDELMTSTLGFFTQHELDSVVGHSRRRQRLVAGGVLPPGEHLKAFGREGIIFPEFVAAGLIVNKPTRQDAPLLARVRELAERLYRLESFGVMAEVMRVALRETQHWRLDDLVEAVSGSASDAWLDWRAHVSQAEQALAESGIRLVIEVGRITDVQETGYRVQLADTQETILVGANAARSPLAVGSWVTRDLIELGALKGEVLVPTIAPERIESMSENSAVDEAQEAMWAEMFANTDFKPIAVPYVLEDAAPEAARRETPSAPLFGLRVDAARLAKANTMTTRSRSLTAAQ
jgi:hypothetical protein